MAVTNFKRGTTALSSDFNNPENIQAGNNGVATSKVVSATGESIFLQGFDFQVPTASIINGIEIRTKASKFNPSGGAGSVTVGLSASLQGTDANDEHFATSTFTVNNDGDDPTIYTVGGENQFAGPLHFLTHKNIDKLRLQWQTLVNDFPNERQLALTGSDSGDLFPAVRIHYTPLRWAPVLTSGSNFLVTTLTSSHFKEIAQNGSTVKTVFHDPQSKSLRQTGSIKFTNHNTQQPEFRIGLGTTPNSLFISSSTLSASFVPDGISRPDQGDFRSDILMHQPISSSGAPRGRITRGSTIAIETVLTYTGSISGQTNAQLSSGSGGSYATPAPFTAPTGNDSDDNNIPGARVRFINALNPGDVGYADYSDQRFIEIDKTSPKRGPSDSLEFFITCSFSIPYTQEFGADTDLKVYVVRRLYNEDDFRILGPKTLKMGSSVSTPDQSGTFDKTGSFTGSFILPTSQNDFLLEGETIELRVESDNAGRPYKIGYAPGEPGVTQSVFSFELEDEFTANFKPTIHFDVDGITGSFIGEAWQAYSGSIGNVALNNIPADQGLYVGDGIMFYSGSSVASPTVQSFFAGNTATTASIRLAGATGNGTILVPGTLSPGGPNLTGLTFALPTDCANQLDPFAVIAGKFPPGVGKNSLTFTSSFLPTSSGLIFKDPDGDFSEIRVDLSGSSDGTSGLRLTAANGLSISNNIGGPGLSLAAGNPKQLSLNINQADLLGLEIVSIQGGDAGLALTGSLTQGRGLSWKFSPSINRSFIQVDFTSSYGIPISSSLGFTASQDSSAPAIFFGVDTGLPIFSQLRTSYSASSDLVFQYATNQHSTLQSISGSLVTSGSTSAFSNSTSSFGTTGTSIHFRTSKFTTQYPFPLINSGAANSSPFRRKTGGIVVQTTSSMSGSSAFYDLGANGGTAASWDAGRVLYEGGWMLTTASAVAANALNAISTTTNPTSVFDNDKIGVIKTVKTFHEENPNLIHESSSFYASASISNYGAFYVDTASAAAGNTSESRVWVYIPD